MKYQHTQYKQMRSVGSNQVVAGIHRQEQTGKQTEHETNKIRGEDGKRPFAVSCRSAYGWSGRPPSSLRDHSENGFLAKLMFVLLFVVRALSSKTAPSL